MKYETLGKGVTPKVPVHWVKVFEPDTTFKAEGEYSVTVILDEDATEAQSLLTKFDEMTEKAFEIETDDLKPGIKKRWTTKAPYTHLEDEETGEPTGQVKLTFKAKASGTNTKGKEWKRTIPVFDANGKRIESIEGYIGNGSKGKIAYQAKSYANSKDKEIGVSLKLDGFQLIELLGVGTGSAEDLGFEAEAGGYEHADSAYPTPVDSDNSDFKDETGNEGDF